MSQVFKDHFSEVSKAYREFRPEYPEELFQWLAEVAPARERALDCGCGTGQATVALARCFDEVTGVDPSAKQIEAAIADEKVRYLVAPAEQTGVPQGSQDLIIAAQALHWFDLDAFYAEVRRVARPQAVFAAITYGLFTLTPELDRVLGRLYGDMLGSYWPPERRHVDAGYRTLAFPFEEIAVPEIAMTVRWSFEQVIGYLSTWSAVKEYKAKTGEDPVALVGAELEEAWGDRQESRQVAWPLKIRAGRVK
ncbi:class I SAM-dependent methyltransferase [Geomonas sp.]|uniref:class I SAM-dependent methyltransferase n=1 Tax=Geomonas sp. TaxID=2651584 RepID=UPI002B45FE1B|nr:class I SAM-dependent methyltransferase [Geomonas sp.]HJV35836.1 class I SAM-dependent methyltransferase [Geomonas sp.]